MTECGSMESHKAGFPPLPHSLEIPLAFSPCYSLDDDLVFRNKDKEPTKDSPNPRKRL